MTKTFEYVGVCRGTRLFPETVEARNISEAVEEALEKLNMFHGGHEIAEIKEIAEVKKPKKFALRVFDTKSARILVYGEDKYDADHWYDLEDADYLAKLATEFKRLEDEGYEYVDEVELDD